ncbi:MAG: GNAT family N-acetyltransferase [Anaerolineae bacterium]|nr:GNAT family N-acetyltransferase [Anaerolineae bacterium]
MNVQIDKATVSDQVVLRQLLELYLYDFSPLDGSDVDEHGTFGYPYLDHYWTEAGRHPFLVRVDGKLAGFALVRQIDDEPPRTEMAEFFIMRKYRGQGVGRQVATTLFDRFPGCWRVGQETSNTPAQAFWRGVIGRYTNGKFEEIRVEDWDGPMQTFVAR